MKINFETLKKQKPFNADKASTFPWYNLAEGDNYFTILPPWGPESKGLPYFEASLHYLKDIEGKAHNILCARSYGAPCPICQRSIDLYKSGDVNDKELSKIFRASNRALYNVLTSDYKTFVYSASYTIHTAIFTEIIEDVNNEMDPTDPNNSLQCIVNRTGKGLTSKYSFRAGRNRVSIPEQHRNIPLKPLHTIYPKFSYEDLERMLNGDFSVKDEKDESLKFDTAEFDKQNTPSSNGPALSQPLSTPLASASKLSVDQAQALANNLKR